MCQKFVYTFYAIEAVVLNFVYELVHMPLRL